jgi:pilus assembly protein CpaB
MKSRLIAAGIAVVLAAVGTVVVLTYVRGADARAMSGLDTVEVLVAAEPIAEGTLSTDLTNLVASKELPANAVLANRITSIDQLAGDVALVALEPGEQLLGSKFGPPATTNPHELTIPPKFQQVTVLLELQRALGGRIEAGDTVGMFLSVTGTKKTHLTAQKVLVTRVERAAATGATASGQQPSSPNASGTDPAAPTAEPPPSSLTESLLVTVATTAAISEKIVFAAEFGSIWLSDEPPTADTSGTQVVDGTLVFK